MRILNRGIWTGIVIVLTVAFIPFLFAYPDSFRVRQYEISGKILSHDPLNLIEAWRMLRSRYSFGVNNLTRAFNANVDYRDPNIFFGYLFSRFPTYAIVYPTETYYYWTATMADGRVLSGNMRLLDAKDGVLHIGYFDKNDPHNEESSGWTADFGSDQGVFIETINDFEFDVTYSNKTIRFILSNFISESPKKLKILPEEEFVSQIFDESGMRFFLFYNNLTKSFYFILNEEVAVNEKFTEIADGYFLGKDTTFVYYHDLNYDRKLLVGVSSDAIFQNDYYDGPFDQVPPRLPIKEKLENAYPYVKYHGGIDDHGNFKEEAGSRVAISPYYNYENVDDLITYLSRCKESEGKSLFWSCLTYEWKKDFHKTLEAEEYPMTESVNNHAVYSSQGWPANHAGSASITWPTDHTQKSSSNWRKGYVP